jgi:L,D-transpeptidase ErfK/SrfK
MPDRVIPRLTVPGPLARGLLLLPLLLAGCMKEPVVPLPPPTPKVAAPPRPVAPGPQLTLEVEPTQRVVGVMQATRVRGEETLLDIARRFHLGYDEIVWANRGVDVWLPGEGREVVLPTAQILPDAPHTGLVANVAARRLFHFLPPDASGKRRLVSYPIGIGREAYPTPIGSTYVTRKRAYPDWRVPASVRRAHAKRGDPLPAVVPGGPDSPIGTHVVDLGWPTYIIHSTNKPAGTGLRVTHGCLQLYPEDITRLYDEVTVGSEVTVVNQPILVGWQGDQLLLEVHKPLEEHAMTATEAEAVASVAIRKALAARGRDEASVDWARVRTYVQAKPGYPLPVLKSAPDQAAFVASLPLHEEVRPLASLPAPSSRGSWYLDLGSYSGESNARKLVAQLRHLGPPVRAEHRPFAGRHEVTAGPFADREHAERIAHRIEVDLGLRTQVKPPAGGTTDAGA